MMPPLHLSFAEQSSAGLNSNGANFMASGPGDWVVNLGGSGTSFQGAAAAGTTGASIPVWVWIAAAVAAALYLGKK